MAGKSMTLSPPAALSGLTIDSKRPPCVRRSVSMLPVPDVEDPLSPGAAASHDATVAAISMNAHAPATGSGLSANALASAAGGPSHVSLKYHRLVVLSADGRYSKEEVHTSAAVRSMLAMRVKYLFKPITGPAAADEQKRFAGPIVWKAVDGVYRLYPAGSADAKSSAAVAVASAAADGKDAKSDAVAPGLAPIAGWAEFSEDLRKLWKFVRNAPARTICFKRLQLLEKKALTAQHSTALHHCMCRPHLLSPLISCVHASVLCAAVCPVRVFCLQYQMYLLLNGELETESSRDDPRDFYNIDKVDNHIHIAAAMTSRHLLQFIKKKAKTAANDVVMKDPKTGAPQTLGQVFAKLGLTADNISIDGMAVSGGGHMFHRFDQFNNAYSPFGYNDMRTIFSKVNNLQNGKYFAELVKEVFDLLDTQANSCYLEPRISVYASGRQDWAQTAAFVVNNGLLHARVAWMVQVPRLYELYAKNKLIKNFQEMLVTPKQHQKHSTAQHRRQ
jgi:hypothetical protein